MQPSAITLPVDIQNNGTTQNREFTRYVEQQDRTVYIGTNHLPESREMLTLNRTMPTRNGNFKGVSKSSAKFTIDQTVPGVDNSTTLTAPLILEISFSVPVGLSASDLIKIRQHAVALLDDDSVMTPLNIQLQI